MMRISLRCFSLLSFLICGISPLAAQTNAPHMGWGAGKYLALIGIDGLRPSHLLPGILQRNGGRMQRPVLNGNINTTMP